MLYEIRNPLNLYNSIIGEVIKHNDCRVILNEGMPHHRNPDERGDLIINYKVLFPDKISRKNVDLLANLLPCKSDPLIPDSAIHLKLVQVSERDHADDEDHSGGGEAQGVRCATQ